MSSELLYLCLMENTAPWLETGESMIPMLWLFPWPLLLHFSHQDFSMARLCKSLSMKSILISTSNSFYLLRNCWEHWSRNDRWRGGFSMYALISSMAHIQSHINPLHLRHGYSLLNWRLGYISWQYTQEKSCLCSVLHRNKTSYDYDSSSYQLPFWLDTRILRVSYGKPIQ